ncbi:hypothetical protein DPMN_145082 [Dreissena polymorpha]|uniref:Uncharacterized protein n=1 Tax=Dreissena polymorpha TaxID=45954 RepID=A0A9D4F5B7_DREPO|nr:hypothetical protein DPMN_145082 [Dreissena polymorpha]
MTEQIDDVRSNNARLETDLANKEREQQAKNERVSNMEEERDWLADMLNESQSVSFYDSIEGKYSYELRQCIYTLLSLNVSAQNVEHVIKCVLKIVGKQCEKLPARSTVLNMNVERLILSQMQLGEVMPEKTNLSCLEGYSKKMIHFGLWQSEE